MTQHSHASLLVRRWTVDFSSNLSVLAWQDDAVLLEGGAEFVPSVGVLQVAAGRNEVELRRLLAAALAHVVVCLLIVTAVRARPLLRLKTLEDTAPGRRGTNRHGGGLFSLL